MRRLMLLSVAAMLAGGILYAQAGRAQAPLAARVVGLQVAAKVPGDDMMLQPFNSSPGVALAVLVRSADKSIIDFDDDASRLTSLKDDKGTDLQAGSEDSWQPTFGFPNVSEDGKSVLFELRGATLPAAGSNRIRAEGVVTLVLGSVLEKARQKGVALQDGAAITVGPVPFTIKDVDASGSYGSALSITLAAKKEISAIKAIRFYSPAGAELETQDMGSMTMTMMNTVSVDKQIGFEQKPGGTVDVEIEYWKDMERRQVPLKLDVGLALQ